MPVEDNAVLTLGEPGRRAPWATFHVSWSEWKNEFSLEIYTRHTEARDARGLAGSYGPQTLRIWRMRPEMGPPDLEEIAYPAEDASWAAEWAHFRAAIAGDATSRCSATSTRPATAWSAPRRPTGRSSATVGG